MELKHFIEKSLETESRIETVAVNELALTSTIKILIAMGNLLDQMKKHIFYGKEYDLDAWAMHMNTTEEAFCTLSTLTASELNHNEQDLPVNPRIFHSIVGCATESTELLEALDLYGGKMDGTNLLEEFGDIDWYKAIGIDELNGDWDQILETIVRKLALRKQNDPTLINRDLEAEREILETVEYVDHHPV